MKADSCVNLYCIFFSVEPVALESPTKARLRREKKMYQNRFYRLKKKKPRSPKKTSKKFGEKRRKEALIQELGEYLPPATLEFVATRIRLGHKKRTRWTDKDKCIALSLFHTSPKAYQIVKKLFALPSVSTLRRAVQKVKVHPGFNANILQALKAKVAAMPKGSELCALVFDEVSIKESVTYNVERDLVEGLEDFGNFGRTKYVANHATVFMVRGLIQRWKQPMGYFLSSGTISSSMLQSLLLEALDKVKEIGLEVKVIICHQGSNNRSALEKLGVKEQSPSFLHEGVKYLVLYDPPHLLKNVRNNLKKSGFTSNGKLVSWHYIEQFFNFDKCCRVRMAPKLTEKHINLPPFAALRVKFAAQVLSRSVASGISTMVQAKLVPAAAEETSVFLETFDKLFNTFNSGSLRSSQPMRHAISESSGHMSFLLGAKEWLTSICRQRKKKLPCLSGWIMAIDVLLQLWQDLHHNHGVKFFFYQQAEPRLPGKLVFSASG
jgi:glycosyltransferase involved in cell wall biosynthesis